ERPGVTRNEQWIECRGVKILDTPGVLYPEMKEADDIYRLACINCIDPSRIGSTEVLEWFVGNLDEDSRRIISEYYSVDCTDPGAFFETFAERYGISGPQNIASRVFSDYNNGRFKNIMLDRI
ncbi:MAG: hypothetical protein ACOCWO_04225, partial [Candidatus Muiribacteriaceae bacterium]